MIDRTELHTKLVEILGSNNVYFQPPESLKMSYPAIRYNREKIRATRANGEIYHRNVGYTITLMDSNPDSHLIDEILKVPKCSYDRHYVSNNINHDVFTIYS